MKRLAVLLLAGALVALMLQPVSPTVNNPSGNGDSRADGAYPPPFPGSLLVADGAYTAPFPGSLLVADGAYPPPFPGQPLPDGTTSGGWLS